MTTTSKPATLSGALSALITARQPGLRSFVVAFACIWLGWSAITPKKAWTSELTPRVAEAAAVARDLQLILAKAALSPDAIELGAIAVSEKVNQVEISCSDGRLRLNVTASPQEWSSTFYLGLQKLGFLFPHPRIQLSPAREELRNACGRTYEWRPRLRFRGFHLHTEHPSEWMRGFLEGDESISTDTIRWLARNGQNAVQVVLLRTLSLSTYARSLRTPFELARRLGIVAGVSVSFEITQQKSYRLIAPLSLRSKERQIRESIQRLEHAIGFDYLDVELGSTEFTSPSYSGTLRWIETARAELASAGKALFVKIHVSVNQNSAQWGNYNFLPQYSDPGVGIQPHTVMFYGLDDPHTPVYGRKDFQDMKQFMIRENQKRPVWYYPETSYWVAMDIDMPLLLTDYLVARSNDLDLLEANGIPGQITFTTGQELGYWLLDWTTSLLVNAENRGRPDAGLRLLGEDPEIWGKLIRYQSRWFKEEQLISMLSSAIIIDELPPPFKHKLHERFTFAELSKNPGETRREAELLEQAVAERPETSGIRNPELRALMEVTLARVEHAYGLRRALMAKQDRAERLRWVDRAQSVRLAALKKMSEVTRAYSRYPEVPLFARWRNPTSYEFGYGWTAATLHFWEREEMMARELDFSPFFMNIYDIWRVLF